MAFRLVSINVNGIRSAANKGFVEWAGANRIDCMGVQEVKAQHDDVHGLLDRLGPLQGHFHFAQKKGYSGVGLYTRHEPSDVVRGMGVSEFDDEGRWVEARFDTRQRKLSLISCYFPSGSSSPQRQEAKFRFLEQIYPRLIQLQQQREFVLMGDVNIAHREIDLKNWKGNLKNSGFLPEERAWMDQLLGPSGLVDVYRQLHPSAEQYTWWSNRGQARAKNVGWRIDYHLATPGLAHTARAAAVYTAERFSDHAPVIIDYDFTL